jgi:hypothetical protein
LQLSFLHVVLLSDLYHIRIHQILSPSHISLPEDQAAQGQLQGSYSI